MQGIEFVVRRDGTRKWKITDPQTRKQKEVHVFEWKPVTNEGLLTSEMARLIPAVDAYEAAATQLRAAMTEIACMPHVIEAEIVRDPTSRTQLTMQTSATPATMGAAYTSGSTISLDGAGLMSAKGFHPHSAHVGVPPTPCSYFFPGTKADA